MPAICSKSKKQLLTPANAFTFANAEPINAKISASIMRQGLMDLQKLKYVPLFTSYNIKSHLPLMF